MASRPRPWHSAVRRNAVFMSSHPPHDHAVASPRIARRSPLRSARSTLPASPPFVRAMHARNTDAGSVAEIFMHPTAVLGLSDAGAHITQFSEAGQTSQLLGHWVRERGAR